MDATALGPPRRPLSSVALVFRTFSTACHDAANSIATIVSTRVLPPRGGGIWAAFFNLHVHSLVFLDFTSAQTIGTGIIRSLAVVDPRVIFAALMGRGSPGT